MTPMKLCLLVDDYEVIRKVARPIVEQLGYVVTEAGTAEDAARQCHKEMPDLIVVDWSLPDGSTHDLIASIRSDQTDRYPQILYLVTENDPADLKKALSVGADDYVFKPFDRDSLQRKICEMTGTTLQLYAEADAD